MIEHTPGPWKYLTPRSGLKRTQDIAIFALNGQQVANVHSGAMPHQQRPDHKEAEGNADLIMKAREVPHECSNPQCPGNVHRRKLKAFDGLLDVCERFYSQLSKEIEDEGATVFVMAEASHLLSAAEAAITKAKE